jgi:Zn-dependent protease
VNRFVHVSTVRRVPIYVHWTVFAICIFLLGAGLRHIVAAALGMTCYLTILVVHELGHQVAATLRRYTVDRIEIYPFHGVCKLEEAEYPLDAAVIAWGGVLAQFALALPLAGFVFAFGYTGFGVIDLPLAILGFVSPAFALFNLLPVAPLDGKVAWSYFGLRFGTSFRQKPAKQKTALEALEDALKKAKHR